MLSSSVDVKILSIPKAKRQISGRIKVKGTIARISSGVYHIIESVTCPACGFKDVYPIPRYKCASKCPRCRELDRSSNSSSSSENSLVPAYTPVVDLKIQDEEETLTVKVLGEELQPSTPGQTVNVIGNLHVLRKNNKAETVLFAESI